MVNTVQEAEARVAGKNGDVPHIQFPPNDKRPCYQFYGRAFISEEKVHDPGVYYHGFNEDKEGNRKPFSRRILSPINVLAIVRTDAGMEHSYLVEYLPHGENVIRRCVMPQSILLGRAEEVTKFLRPLGVTAHYQDKDLIRTYLDYQHDRFDASTPSAFWHSAKTVGWHSRSSFVLPTEIIGKQDGVWYSGRCEAYGKLGKLEEWQTQVAKPCEGNDYLIFALSAAFAGPLLELLNIPGVGFHYYGDSTTGKSSALAVSASPWGPPTFMLSWRGTVNGLESVAASRSSTLTALDESHLIDPKHLDSGVYLLLNGTSKSRMTRDIKAQELTYWRNCVLSSGERSIEAHLTGAGIDHKAGQGVRIIDVPVTGKYGIFDDLHGAVDIRGCASGSVFADSLRNASAEHYGFAGPLFVESLIKNMKSLNLQTHLSGILGKDGGIGLNAQEARVQRSFALVALAGELAIEFGLLPLEPGCVTKAASKIFSHWRQTQETSEASKEHSQILRAIADFTEKHNDSRFSNVNWKPDINQYGSVINEEPVIRDRAGYWEDKPDRPRIYLFTSVGLRDATKSFDHSRVIKSLDLAGAFSDKGAKERAKSCRVPDGRSIKLYHIDSSKLKSEPKG